MAKTFRYPISYNAMPELLKNRIPFRGNSVTAIKENGLYTVYSYSTPILKLGEIGELQFDNKYYSTTTSKLQNMLIDIFDLNGGIKKRDTSKKE